MPSAATGAEAHQSTLPGQFSSCVVLEIPSTCLTLGDLQRLRRVANRPRRGDDYHEKCHGRNPDSYPRRWMRPRPQKHQRILAEEPASAQGLVAHPNASTSHVKAHWERMTSPPAQSGVEARARRWGRHAVTAAGSCAMGAAHFTNIGRPRLCHRRDDDVVRQVERHVHVPDAVIRHFLRHVREPGRVRHRRQMLISWCTTGSRNR